MLLLGDVEQLVLVHGGCWTLTLELEDHHTSIVTRSKQVHVRVGSNDPESVLVAFEGLHRCAFVQVPHTNCLVLADRENEVLVRVEQTGRSVLEMATASINLPSLGVAHAPELDESIVTRRHDQWQ